MWKKKGKKKEKQRKRGRESVGKGRIYWRLPTDSPTEYSVGKSVIDFAGGSDTSLLGCPGLNPSVYSVGKFVWIKSTSSRCCNFQKKFHVPSANSDRIWDGIISVGNFYQRKVFVGNSVGVIWFSGSDKLIYIKKQSCNINEVHAPIPSKPHIL